MTDSLETAQQQCVRLRARVIDGDDDVVVIVGESLRKARDHAERNEHSLSTPYVDLMVDLLSVEVETTSAICLARRQLIGLLIELGRWDDVLNQQSKLLDEHSTLYGPRSLRSLATRTNRASTLARLGMIPEAIAEARQTQPLIGGQVGFEHPLATVSAAIIATAQGEGQ